MQVRGRRFYIPPLGRWASRDPIEEEDGMGLYRFVHNSVLSLLDALGTTAINVTHTTVALPGSASSIMDFFKVEVTISIPPPAGCHLNFIQIKKPPSATAWSLDSDSSFTPYYLKWNEISTYTSVNAAGQNVLSFFDSPGGPGWGAGMTGYFYLLVVEVCRKCVVSEPAPVVGSGPVFIDTDTVLATRFWSAKPLSASSKVYACDGTSGLLAVPDPTSHKLTKTELQAKMDALVNAGSWTILLPTTVTVTLP